MSKFEGLPKWIQTELVQYFFDTETKVETLDRRQKIQLSLATPTELFDAWLIWTGIVGYTSQILDVHSAIFGPPLTQEEEQKNIEKFEVEEFDVHKAVYGDEFEAPIILKLYRDANSENFMTRTGFPTVEEAQDFIRTWEAAGHSAAWVKC